MVNAVARSPMTDLYASVYQALDASVANNRCLASSDAQIQRALTQFRLSGKDREAAEQLEAIALQLHQLSVASLNGNRDQRRAAIERLRASAQTWMQRLPMQ
jgi:hypothetical protein